MEKGYHVAVVCVLVCIIACSTPAAADEVTKWCAKTGKPSECSMIVHHNPEHTPLKHYPADMGVILLSTSIQKANGIKEFLSDSLSNGPATATPQLITAFDRCTSPFGWEAINFQSNIGKLGLFPDSCVEVADWLAGVEKMVVERCKSYHPKPLPAVSSTLFSKVDDYVTLLKITEQLLRAK